MNTTPSLPRGSEPLLANDRSATARHPGRCTLVGAGPGDPELLTLKAVKAIACATVLLVDDLVNDAVLEHASPSARIVHVGKRGGCKSTPQAFIDKLMIQAVQEGEHVVRLKGMSSLGAPLTHREHAHGVVFVTGHAKPGDSGTDWVQLATTAHQAKLTLVIYMGVSSLNHISQGLLQGLPAHTPVAIVQHASLPTQREALTTLGELVGTVQREQLQSPSIIVVGDVVQGARAWQQAEPNATEQRAA